MTIWAMLPAFNEGKNLPALLGKFVQVARLLEERIQIVIVDDGSTDDTSRVAREWATQAPIKLLKHEQNRGLAETMRTGLYWILENATCINDVVVTLDADNTQPPDLIHGMLNALNHGADVVIASRYVPTAGEVGVPALRRVLSLTAGWLLRLRYGVPGVSDYTCGFRAYRVSVLRAAANTYGNRFIESQGFGVTTELLLKVSQFAQCIQEIPIYLRYDLKLGRSKLPLIRTLAEYVGLLLSPAFRPKRRRGKLQS